MHFWLVMRFWLVDHEQIGVVYGSFNNNCLYAKTLLRECTNENYISNQRIFRTCRTM